MSGGTGRASEHEKREAGHCQAETADGPCRLPSRLPKRPSAAPPQHIEAYTCARVHKIARDRRRRTCQRTAPSASNRPRPPGDRRPSRRQPALGDGGDRVHSRVVTRLRPQGAFWSRSKTGLTGRLCPVPTAHSLEMPPLLETAEEQGPPRWEIKVCGRS